MEEIEEEEDSEAAIEEEEVEQEIEEDSEVVIEEVEVALPEAEEEEEVDLEDLKFLSFPISMMAFTLLRDQVPISFAPKILYQVNPYTMRRELVLMERTEKR